MPSFAAVGLFIRLRAARLAAAAGFVALGVTAACAPDSPGGDAQDPGGEAVRGLRVETLAAGQADLANLMLERGVVYWTASDGASDPAGQLLALDAAGSQPRVVAQGRFSRVAFYRGRLFAADADATHVLELSPAGADAPRVVFENPAPGAPPRDLVGVGDRLAWYDARVQAVVAVPLDAAADDSATDPYERFHAVRLSAGPSVLEGGPLASDGQVIYAAAGVVVNITVLQLPADAMGRFAVSGSSGPGYSPNALAVDDQYVYWSESGSLGGGGVRRASKYGGRSPLDGDDELVIARFQHAPGAITVHGTHVFWVTGAGAVVMAERDGRRVRRLVTDQPTPSAVAADDAYVYWSNRGDGTIHRAAIPD